MKKKTKITFTAHTVREFPREWDFEMFMAYFCNSKMIPKGALATLMKNGEASITTWDGDHQDCKAHTTWKIEK